MPIYLFTRQLWNRSVRRRLRRHEQSFVTSQLWHTGRSGLRSSDTTQPLSHSSSLHQRFVYVSHRQCYFRQQNLKWKRQATEQGLIQKSSMEEDDGISEQKPSEAPPPNRRAKAEYFCIPDSQSRLQFLSMRKSVGLFYCIYLILPCIRPCNWKTNVVDEKAYYMKKRIMNHIRERCTIWIDF